MGLDERKQERIIDSVLYEVTPLPFAIGNKALLRFVRLATPVISKFISSKPNGSTQQLAIASAISELQNISDDDIDYFAKVFGTASKYQNGDKMVPLVDNNREAHFSMRYMAFYEWLAFCIEVNFTLFFGELTKRLGSGVPAEATVS